MAGEAPDRSPRARPPEHESGRPGLGTLLRDARLRHGLTIGEAAADTRINALYLEAIEAERWDVLPAPVYARGFARSYGRYLKVDREAVEELLPRDLPRPAGLEPAPGLRRRTPGNAGLPLAWPSRWRAPDVHWPGLPRPRTSASNAAGRASPSSDRRAARGSEQVRRVAASVRAASGGRSASRRRAAGGPLRGLPPLDARSLGLIGGALALSIAIVVGALQFRGGSDPVPGEVAGPAPGGTSASPATSASSPAPPAAQETAPVFREGEMPGLVGMTRAEAEQALRDLGLSYVVIEVPTDRAPAGSVFNHSPEAGKAVKRGDSVTLLVARAQ